MNVTVELNEDQFQTLLKLASNGLQIAEKNSKNKHYTDEARRYWKARAAFFFDLADTLEKAEIEAEDAEEPEIDDDFPEELEYDDWRHITVFEDGEEQERMI